MSPTQVGSSSQAVRGVLVLAGVLALAACSQKPAAQRGPEPGDRAVATVNGQTVWASDVKREAVAEGLIGEGEPLDVGSDQFRQMLDEVVDEKLLAAEALRRHMDRDPVAQRRLAAARERILGDMLVDGVVDRAVTDQAVQTLYQEQLKLAKPADEIHARQIVVASPADAEAVRKQLAAGASFEALATQRSIDVATRFSGGDLGYFATDSMPAAYAAALKTTRPGQVVGPFRIEGGYAILRVEDRRPEQTRTLEEERPQIVRFLSYDEVRDLLKHLRDHSKVSLLIGPPAQAPGAPSEPASAPPASERPPGQSPPSAAESKP
jgi:peptidyl-prolyl cis-trans isomerase C